MRAGAASSVAGKSAARPPRLGSAPAGARQNGARGSGVIGGGGGSSQTLRDSTLAIPFITLCITNELARATARPCTCRRSPGSIPVSTPLALADALAAKVATEGSAGHDWRATQYIEIAFGGTASPHVHRPSPLLQAPRQTDVLLPSNYPSFPRLYVTLTTRSSTPENSRTPGVPTASRYPSTKAPQGCCGSRKPLGHTRTIQLAWRSRSGTPASAVAPE